MAPPKRDHVGDLRGASRLVIAATRGVTDVVEAMHHAIAGGPDVLGRPLARPVRLLTAPAYGTIRVVTDLVGTALDTALSQVRPVLGSSAPGAERDVLQAVLNGVVGDYLKETRNALAIEARLLEEGEPLVAAVRHGRVLVLVHGSSMSPRQWTRRGHNHGDALGRDLGHTVIHLDYNSGLHISTNGRSMAALLEELGSSADEIVLLAHSMGGLVSRSACHYAEVAGHVWRSKLRALVCLGSPHQGASLERAGTWADLLLGATRYSAPLARLGRVRSAGITDMRFGNVLDSDWGGATGSTPDQTSAPRSRCPPGSPVTRSRRRPRRTRAAPREATASFPWRAPLDGTASHASRSSSGTRGRASGWGISIFSIGPRSTIGSGRG